MIPGEIEMSLISWFREKQQLNFRIFSAQTLGGGCINNVLHLETSLGNFCMKYNFCNSYPLMFEAEARGLQLLKSSNAIRVPEVIAVQTLSVHSYILLEYIVTGVPVRGLMEEFGRSLAKLHCHHDQYFGLDHDNYMGSLPQCNTRHIDWVSFFTEERLQPQVRKAVNSGALPSNAIPQFDRLYKKLDGLFPEEKPSLLHGDLWNGNFLTSESGKACLIDPAVYYGHREIDIAMTKLFGGFDQGFYTGYQEILPMESGWKERMDLYNLYPLMIHLNLFGSGYLGSILTIIRKY